MWNNCTQCKRFNGGQTREMLEYKLKYDMEKYYYDYYNGHGECQNFIYDDRSAEKIFGDAEADREEGTTKEISEDKL